MYMYLDFFLNLNHSSKYMCEKELFRIFFSHIHTYTLTHTQKRSRKHLNAIFIARSSIWKKLFLTHFCVVLLNFFSNLEMEQMRKKGNFLCFETIKNCHDKRCTTNRQRMYGMHSGMECAGGIFRFFGMNFEMHSIKLVELECGMEWYS